MKARPTVLFLYEGGLKTSYTQALAEIGFNAVWVTTLEQLFERSKTITPVAIVVDTDSLKRRDQKTLEEIRKYFSAQLIALGSLDSSKLSLLCLQCGFVDYLLKPLTPEELTWNVQKQLHRQETLERVSDSKQRLAQTLGKIASTTSAVLVRMSTLESLIRLLSAKGGGWFSMDRKGGVKSLCSVPTAKISSAELQKIRKSDQSKKEFRILKGRETRTLILRFSSERQYVLIHGIEKKILPEMMSEVKFLLQFAELTLLNLRRFDQIKLQTFLDELTGLYNARYLKFAIAEAVKKAHLHSSSFSILFIDVDHFKTVNDQNGHLVGSDFLIAIGRTIKNSVRSQDLVFRYGGDEFVVLLQGASIGLAKKIAERIRKNVAKRSYSIRSRTLQTTVSIGLATFPLHATTEDELLRLADSAMYQAKKTYRNAVQLAEIPLDI